MKILNQIKCLLGFHDFKLSESEKPRKNWNIQRECSHCHKIELGYVAEGSETVGDPSDPTNVALWKQRKISMSPIWISTKKGQPIENYLTFDPNYRKPKGLKLNRSL